MRGGYRAGAGRPKALPADGTLIKRGGRPPGSRDRLPRRRRAQLPDEQRVGDIRERNAAWCERYAEPLLDELASSPNERTRLEVLKLRLGYALGIPPRFQLDVNIAPFESIMRELAEKRERERETVTVEVVDKGLPALSEIVDDGRPRLSEMRPDPPKTDPP